MNQLDYLHDAAQFTELWQRACSYMKKVPTIPTTELLYFDSSCLGTEKFRDLIRRLAAFSGTGEVAVIVLNPDPFNYFHFHFRKYPGFIVQRHHNDDDFFGILMMDPGGSPADAIGFYSEQYVVLPIVGEWFMYADRAWNWGTGVLSGPEDVMAFAQESFTFDEKPG
jgi:hypothetical protein